MSRIERMLYQEHTPSANVYLAYCFLVSVLAGSYFTQVIDPLGIPELAVIVALPFLCLFPFQWATEGTLPSYAYLGHGLVGLGWSIGFHEAGMSYFVPPVAAPLNTYFGLPAYIGYYALGLLLFSLLATSHFWAQRRWQRTTFVATLFTGLDLILALPPIGQALFYAYSAHHLPLPGFFYTFAPSWQTMYALALTDTDEFHMAIYAILLAILTALCYWANTRMAIRTQVQRGVNWLHWLALGYLVLLAGLLRGLQ